MSRPSNNIFTRYPGKIKKGLIDFSDTLKDKNVKVVISLGGEINKNKKLRGRIKKMLSKKI